jgi:uncharacterized membrane protein (UPF0127 family)
MTKTDEFHAGKGRTGPDGRSLAFLVGSVVRIPDVRMARRFHERFLGLMGRRRLEPGVALWLQPCRGIHTLGMRFAIDVLFLDGKGRVLRIARNVRPWRLAWAPRGTQSVVEVASGWLTEGAIRTGDRMETRPTGIIA